MPRLYVNRSTLMEFLQRLSDFFPRPGRLYLVGESIPVFEGWSAWSEKLEFTADISPDDRPSFDQIISRLAEELDIRVYEESPAQVLPLPNGYAERARPADLNQNGRLAIYYFDPYSIAFRMITRGDESDYRAVLAFLKHGWVTVGEMDALLRDLLPQFTRETIAQDPAEFRRKYRGLMQMWRAR
jgi:hypothetical protein